MFSYIFWVTAIGCSALLAFAARVEGRSPWFWGLLTFAGIWFMRLSVFQFPFWCFLVYLSMWGLNLVRGKAGEHLRRQVRERFGRADAENYLRERGRFSKLFIFLYPAAWAADKIRGLWRGESDSRELDGTRSGGTAEPEEHAPEVRVLTEDGSEADLPKELRVKRRPINKVEKW